MEHEDRITHILLHTVKEIGKHKVKGILQTLYTAKQGLLSVVVLKANKRDALPVVCGGLAFFVKHGEVGAGGGIIIHHQGIILPDITINATAVDNFNLEHNLLLVVFVVDINGEKMHRTIEYGVLGVSPKGQNILGGEHCKSKLVFIVVREHPHLAAGQGSFGNDADHTHNLFVKHLGKCLTKGLIFCIKGNRLATKVICLLVNHLGILVINHTIIGQVFHLFKLALFANNSTLTQQNILLALIIGIALNLLFAFRGCKPRLDLVLQKFFVGHSRLYLHCHPGHKHRGCLCMQV